ncbi:MAG: TIGR03435 family protein [Terracidiphilus sp.]
MPTPIVRIALMVFTCCLAHGQTTDKPRTFDVASVKLATVPDGVTINGDMMVARRGVAVPRETGGPGTQDPARIHYPLVSLKDLLGRAYGPYFEIVGPGWLDTKVVQVDATMPPETTKEQLREMLRNLIVDRFGLKFHLEKKEVAGYVLAVAKSGPKMNESVEDAAPQEPDGSAEIQRSPLGPDGFPTQPPLPPGRPGLRIFFTNQGRRRVFGQQQTMHDLADSLASQLRQDAGGPTGPRVIVSDATGLSARYDYELTFSRDGTPDAETLPNVFSALQSQLGLKLEPKKVPVDVMVIDHMEKTPTAN